MSHENSEHRGRSAEFWFRAGGIYASYKAAQAQAMLLRLRGKSDDYIKHEHWSPQHDRSGRQMYDLCIDMRGFFIKVLPWP
jgi:hypothetical protein